MIIMMSRRKFVIVIKIVNDLDGHVDHKHELKTESHQIILNHSSKAVEDVLLAL